MKLVILQLQRIGGALTNCHFIWGLTRHARYGCCVFEIKLLVAMFVGLRFYFELIVFGCKHGLVDFRLGISVFCCLFTRQMPHCIFLSIRVMILPKLIWRPQIVFVSSHHILKLYFWIKVYLWQVDERNTLFPCNASLHWGINWIWCHGSWYLCVHIYLQLLSPSCIKFVLFSIIYGTLMMNVIHYGFQGLVFMLKSIADNTFLPWKKTLPYLTQYWLLCTRLSCLWRVQVCSTFSTSRMMMILFRRWRSNLISIN